MSSGIRWFRVEDMDLYASQDQPVSRSNKLREMVDALPDMERHLLERVFFGGAPMCVVAQELKVSEKRAREIRTRALGLLRGMLEADEMGPLLSATVGEVG